jgi:hypothetical protein
LGVVAPKLYEAEREDGGCNARAAVHDRRLGDRQDVIVDRIGRIKRRVAGTDDVARDRIHRLDLTPKAFGRARIEHDPAGLERGLHTGCVEQIIRSLRTKHEVTGCRDRVADLQLVTPGCNSPLEHLRRDSVMPQ